MGIVTLAGSTKGKDSVKANESVVITYMWRTDLLVQQTFTSQKSASRLAPLTLESIAQVTLLLAME